MLLYLVPTGYNITFNATEYEFDVSVYSPIGTTVFEALLIFENVTVLQPIINFDGESSDFAPYSINGMNSEVAYNSLDNGVQLLTIALDEDLDPSDENVDYSFAIHYFAIIDLMVFRGSVNVILHETGKLFVASKYVFDYLLNVLRLFYCNVN